MNLETIDRFEVSIDIIEHTDETLRRAGGRGLEVFVLWSGVIDGTTFRCQAAHVPRQSSYQLDTGLMVRVEADELHRLNMWLFENEHALAVQVHAHPTDAFHSETDDTYPIVTTLGGLSLVAADFGRYGILGFGTAGYRLDTQGWHELTTDELHDTVRIVG